MEDAQNFEILLGNVLGEALSEKALSASSNDCHTSGGEELSELPEETGALSPDPIAISSKVSDRKGKIVNCPGNPKGRMI